MAKKPGKYEHVLARLPRIAATSATGAMIAQERVNATKEMILEPGYVPIDEDYPMGLVFGAEYGVPHGVPHLLQGCEVVLKRVHRLLLRQCAGQRQATGFAQAYIDLRRLKDTIDGWESNTNLLLEAYSQLMIDQMEAEGVTAIELRSGHKVSMHLEPAISTPDPEAFRQWCLVQPDLPNKMVLHPSTAASLVKSMLERGEPLPPGIDVKAKMAIRRGGDK